MGYVKLDLRCPTNAPMVASVEPHSIWTLDDLLSELNSLELYHGVHHSVSDPLKEAEFSSFSEVKETKGSNMPFVVHFLEDEIGESESEDEVTSYSLTSGSRFTCDVFLSESDVSDDEMYKESNPSSLMEKKNIEERILFEIESEHHLILKEQLRSKLFALECSQKNESEKTSLAMHMLEKQAEARREMDRRLDKQYQRRIAEILDNHLSILQRNYEQSSQIEERRIRDDAALEEAKRKEKAQSQERLRQEKAKAEAEAILNAIKLAEAQKATLVAERKEAEVAAEKTAVRIREAASVDTSKEVSTELKEKTNTKISANVKQGDFVSKPPGIKVVASETALKAEAYRLKIYNEVSGKISLFAPKDIDRHGRQMSKNIKQIGGNVDIVRSRAHSLVQLINAPTLPLPISIIIFANKVVSFCEKPSESFDKSAFAIGWVILLVAQQVPNVVDFVIAELNRACIYTVPKHLKASDVSLQPKDYHKLLGFREVDGKIESTKNFLERVKAFMKLYAALIQTEIEGVKNPHGLEHGWAWLAMFLNALPANKVTAVALEAFLRVAGYALHKKYKSQFMKILNIISTKFLPALKLQGKDGEGAVMPLEQYLNDKVYLQEPEGRVLQGSCLSRTFDGSFGG